MGVKEHNYGFGASSNVDKIDIIGIGRTMARKKVANKMPSIANYRKHIVILVFKRKC